MQGISACPEAQPGTPSWVETALCLRRLFLPPDSEGVVVTADATAENRAFLKALFPAARIRPAPKAEVLAALTARFTEAISDEAVWGLARRMPALSARHVLTPGQHRLLWSLGIVLAVALYAAPQAALNAIFAMLTLGFLASALFRGLLALVAMRPVRAPAPPDDTDLPSYTVLVPLYREAAALPGLARALLALDYPRARLDIKLAVEADDAETVEAARRLGAPFEVVIVPPGGPRTKPKACNYALAFARGELLVIYDAEDRPAPDQLRKAAAAFRAAPRHMACLQARLAFHNEKTNWLTRMFAIDYALWFEVLLPGLDRLGVPMPLGGTSNHFRMAVLRQIGAWDAFNVTEDADIGIRLSQFGFRTGMLDSVTLEECPAHMGAWLRQRSRWLKGYMQTWLVHMRDPAALLRRTGLAGFLAFQLFIGGGVLFAVANPLLWLGLILSWLLHWQLWGIGFGVVPGTGLLVANLVLTCMAAAGPRRSLYGLTVMAYWALVSLAGYRALWQLATRPFYWEKTSHGAGPA